MTTKKNNAVLWYALAGFGLLCGAWTTLFIVAAHHRVPEVPLAHRSATP